MEIFPRFLKLGPVHTAYPRIGGGGIAEAPLRLGPKISEGDPNLATGSRPMALYLPSGSFAVQRFLCFEVGAAVLCSPSGTATPGTIQAVAVSANHVAGASLGIANVVGQSGNPDGARVKFLGPCDLRHRPRPFG
jgi:hypothetical protein